MRNWGNMSTTAHGTPKSRWRCEENLFEGTGAFSSTVRSRQAHHSHVLLACSLAPGKRDALLSQVGSLLLCSSSASQEQTLGRVKEPRAGAAENGSQVPVGSSWWRDRRYIPDSWSWKLGCALLYLNSHFTQLKEIPKGKHVPSDLSLGLDLHSDFLTLRQLTRLITTYRAGIGLTPRLSTVLVEEPGHQHAKHVLSHHTTLNPKTCQLPFSRLFYSFPSKATTLKHIPVTMCLLQASRLRLNTKSICLNTAHLKHHMLLSKGTMPTANMHLSVAPYSHKGCQEH